MGFHAESLFCGGGESALGGTQAASLFCEIWTVPFDAETFPSPKRN